MFSLETTDRLMRVKQQLFNRTTCKDLLNVSTDVVYPMMICAGRSQNITGIACKVSIGKHANWLYFQ